MSILGPFVTFFLFTLGLLAWRLQLIDKRRFEVAEEVLLKYAKMAHLLKHIRLRVSDDGYKEFMRQHNPVARSARYWVYREWMYRIPPHLVEEWQWISKEIIATEVQAEIYLSHEIAEAFRFPTRAYGLVTEASEVLKEIVPFPAIDPHHDESSPGFDPPSGEDDLTNEQMLDLEREYLPIRFEVVPPNQTDPVDELSEAVILNFASLEGMCRPYTNQNPYRFLYRFALSLKPQPGWWEKVRTGKLD